MAIEITTSLIKIKDSRKKRTMNQGKEDNIKIITKKTTTGITTTIKITTTTGIITITKITTTKEKEERENKNTEKITIIIITTTETTGNRKTSMFQET